MNGAFWGDADLQGSPSDGAFPITSSRVGFFPYEEVEVEGRRYDVTASIGIAMYHQDAPDANLLLIAADTAMYQTKAKGKDVISLYQRIEHPTASNHDCLAATLPGLRHEQTPGRLRAPLPGARGYGQTRLPPQ